MLTDEQKRIYGLTGQNYCERCWKMEGIKKEVTVYDAYQSFEEFGLILCLSCEYEGYQRGLSKSQKAKKV
jgi:hypothetical protein